MPRKRSDLSAIVGRFISPSKVEISKNNGWSLRTGQEVFVYRPTEQKIINKRTGTVMGTKDKVLGRGIVVKVGDKNDIIEVVERQNYKSVVRVSKPASKPASKTALPAFKNLKSAKKSKPVYIRVIED